MGRTPNMSSFGVKVIRSLFGAAEHVAPGLAGRAAFELFCRTPDPKTMTSGETRAVKRASALMAEARQQRMTAEGSSLAAHEFSPLQASGNAGTVLVVHGWRSRTEFMAGLIASYRNAGFRVVSLDLPGHGASTGRRLTMASAVAAIRIAADRFGPFAAIVGHSFGGAVAANAVTGSVAGVARVDAKSLVLIAAPSSMPAIFDEFFRHIRLGPRSRAAVAERVRRVAGRPLEDYVGSSLLAQTPVPTLVIHAPDDREVAAWHAEDYAKAGPHVRLHWRPGLGHRRILADADAIKLAVDFTPGEPAGGGRARQAAR